ncbi:MAG: ABC transporter ATP-binding protein [Peptoniphilaceae bacterium]|nr:ABC transporter ATP-binding protein [Peptoniphilaceae bacterium]MDY5765708.1 ABC transporter ATP-binding protein [Peptoniphilaceae bacterium]
MLKIESLYKVFFPGTINEKVALNHLDLTLKDGDFVTVIGGNGAGKSTLLNAVAGTFPVEGGSICLDDIDLTGMPEYKRAKYLSRVFQDPMMGTAPTMQIEENLAIAARRGKRRGLKWQIDARERSAYRVLLKDLDLGLEDRLTTQTALLSGGQRQALTLVMATLQKPRLLLLDEHTAALDPKTAKNVLRLTQKIIDREGLTTLMITHNMKDALQFGNRLIMMNRGQIILDVSGEEKKNLTVVDLLRRFEAIAGDEEISDEMLLS